MEAKESKLDQISADKAKIFKPVRRFKTFPGVVEIINSPPNRSYAVTYAWITTAEGHEVSVKLTPDTLGRITPGAVVQLTRSSSTGAFHIHSAKASSRPTIAIIGTAKWLNRTRDGWAVAITTRSQRVRRKPLLKVRLSSAPDFIQGQQVRFLASFDSNGPNAVDAPSLKAFFPSGAKTAHYQHGVSLPEDLCGWLAEKLGVNAILQDSLRGVFDYTPSRTAGMRVLDREEKAIQDKHSIDNPDLQKLLEKGLKEVRYIEAGNRNLVRQLKRDLVEIDQAGLSREVTVLFPVHDLARPKSFYNTAHSKLLDPNFFNVVSVHLLGNQQLEKSMDGVTHRLSLRVAAITVNSLAPRGMPLPTVLPACVGSIAKSQILWRREQSKQAVKLLIPETVEKKLLPALKRSARVASDDNPLHRAYHPVVATFESQQDASKMSKAIAFSKNPLFMAPLQEFFQKKNNVFNVVTTSATSAAALYDFFQASWCYPISHTNYRFSSSLTWIELVRKMQSEARRGHKHYLSLATDGGNFFTLSDSPKRKAAPASPSLSTLKVTNFPAYISKAALMSSLRKAGLQCNEAYFTQDGGSLLVKVPVESLQQANVEQSRIIDTEFGQVSLSPVRAGTKGLRTPIAHAQQDINTLVAMFEAKDCRQDESRKTSESKATRKPADIPRQGNSHSARMADRAEQPEKGMPPDGDSATAGLTPPPQADAPSDSLQILSAANPAKHAVEKIQDSGGRRSPESKSTSDSLANLSDQRSRLRTLVRQRLDKDKASLLSPILDNIMKADEETRMMLIGSPNELDKEIATLVKSLEKERRNTKRLYGLVLLELTEDTAHHAETITSELMKLDSESFRHLMQSSTHLAESVQRLITEIVSQSPTSTSSTNREQKSDAEASSRHRSSPLPHSHWADLEEEKDRDREGSDLDEDKESSEEEEFVNEMEEQESQTEEKDSEDDETSSPNKKRLKQSRLVDKEASGRNRK